MIQRVSRARVLVAGEEVARCGTGILVLLGVFRGDGEAQAARLAERVARFRMFADDRGRMNRAPAEVGAGAVVVSQVTLVADGRKGRRPSLDRAAPPALAEALYGRFAEALEALGIPTGRGVFGASMEVELVNDGPVTFAFDEPAAAE